MNSRAIESLIKCGAFDGLGANRRQLLAVSKTVLDDLDYESKHNMGGQLSFFDLGDEATKASSEPEIPELSEFRTSDLLYMEKEIAGIYLSGHPIDNYTDYTERLGADKIGEIVGNENSFYTDGKKVVLVCIVSKVKTQLTKTNKIMAFVNIEDRFGTMEAVVFPNIYDRNSVFLNEGTAVIIKGTLNFKENEEPKVICDSIAKAYTNEECENIPMQNIQRQNRPVAGKTPTALYIRIDDLYTDKYNRAKRVLDIFEGSTPVIFYLTDSGRKVKAPQNMWVTLNDVMIKELKFQLGDKNVTAK